MQITWTPFIYFELKPTAIHGYEICISYKMVQCSFVTQISKFMGPTWGPPGSCRSQMGPMLAPRTLISGYIRFNNLVSTTEWTPQNIFLTKIASWKRDISMAIQCSVCNQDNIFTTSFSDQNLNIDILFFHNCIQAIMYNQIWVHCPIIQSLLMKWINWGSHNRVH